MALIILRIFRRIARDLVLLSLKFYCFIKFYHIKSHLFGTKYGNWRLPIDTKATTNVCMLSAGVGEDISFEEQAIDEFSKITVILYDFTPRALLHLHSLFQLTQTRYREYTSGDYFKFYNYGISNFTGDIEVIYPSNPDHVSLRRSKGKNLKEATDLLPVLSAMKEIQKIALEKRFILKFDIEGSEAELLASSEIVSEMSTFKIILLELDFLKFDKIFNWNKPLKGIFQLFRTHKLYYVDDFNIGLIKK